MEIQHVIVNKFIGESADVLNFFAQLFTVSFAIIFGLLVMIILILIFKS